ncbi:metal binding domain of Ada-domain-containing protein [Aspergillus coremiiformis]|uniref:Metal binding domain of Ada-domain-containing protein n=1 Tax=Aspergillus coremiiformis TaxID=138285 RepID=A0A5N6ZCY9_9EURO|nr:metal binding domain of Ada-domain-containing protein [Aspergillus coremiiformis]
MRSQENSPQKITRLSACATQPLSATARWQAVVRRDPTAESFVYAVLTTKIYCRPSCPARLARRANVRFYDTPSQAEKAGFRPCKRCKPEILPAVNPQTQMIQTACKNIQSDVATGSKPTLRKLADQACLTPSHFHRVFKKIMGVTPGQYAAALLKGGSEGPLDECSRDVNMTKVRPCVVGSDQELCLPDCREVVDVFDTGDTVLWNDFDALLAEEAGYAPFVEDFISLPHEHFSGATECRHKDINGFLLEPEQGSLLDNDVQLAYVEDIMPF